jgi:hypothetical protein
LKFSTSVEENCVDANIHLEVLAIVERLKPGREVPILSGKEIRHGSKTGALGD